MNQIIIKNFKIFAYHGVHEHEKTNGQNFFVDVTIYNDKNENFESDNITDTVSYSDVIREIKKIATAKSYNLIEKLSYEIAKSLIFAFPKILKLDVTVKKPQAPIDEEFDYVAVKTSKHRDDFID